MPNIHAHLKKSPNASLNVSQKKILTSLKELLEFMFNKRKHIISTTKKTIRRLNKVLYDKHV